MHRERARRIAPCRVCTVTQSFISQTRQGVELCNCAVVETTPHLMDHDTQIVAPQLGVAIVRPNPQWGAAVRILLLLARRLAPIHTWDVPEPGGMIKKNIATARRSDARL